MRFAAISFALLAPSLAQAAAWEVDPQDSHIAFSAKHLMVSTVRGEFTKFSGTFDLSDKDLTKSNVSVTIDVASLDTREAKRDGHLRSPDFLDAANHPAITFQSKSIKKSGKGYKVAGDLTLRGVTKPVTLEVTGFSAPMADPWGGVRRAFSARTSIKRTDFGVSWNKTLDKGGLLVSEDVAIQIELTLLQKK